MAALIYNESCRHSMFFFQMKARQAISGPCAATYELWEPCYDLLETGYLSEVPYNVSTLLGCLSAECLQKLTMTNA